MSWAEGGESVVAASAVDLSSIQSVDFEVGDTTAVGSNHHVLSLGTLQQRGMQ